MVRRRILALALLALCLAPAAYALTAADLRARMTIDGYTPDFTPDEVVFGTTATGLPEERADDSAWSEFNDVRQIRVTWDLQRLYLAGEATIWGNNLILAVDVMKNRGLADMTQLNSWRRLFTFIPDFAPDLLGCTWDTNTMPRLLLHLSGSTVSDNVPGPLFDARATFDTNQPNRAMEFMIPWSTVFQGATHDTLIDVGGSEPDTATLIPPFTALRLAAFVTGGPDGVSGPDSAPNNLGGHPVDFLVPVTIDNFAQIDVDVNGDGIVDLNVSPRSRVIFHDVSTPARRTTWGGLKARYR